MRRTSIITVGLPCALAVLAAALPQPTTGQDPAPGETIFKGKGSCFACHGPEAKGTALAPDLTDLQWVNFDARPSQPEVEALVRDGVAEPVRHPAPMPPMGGARLSSEEVARVAAYVLSLSAGSERQRDRAADRHPAAREPAAPTTAQAALPTLFSIMLQLQGDMERVSRGIWAESYDTIAAGAQAVADHPKVPSDELAVVAEALGPDLARFKALDTRVHDLSVELAAAARAGDMATVLTRAAAIRQGCVECHTAFRERLRSKLREAGP